MLLERLVRPVGRAAVLVSLLVLSGCQDPSAVEEIESPLFAATVLFSINDIIPLDFTVFDECTGEEVLFSGELHFRIQGVSTPNGFRFTFISNDVGVEGVGQQSGTVYRGTGGTRFIQLFLTQPGIVQCKSAVRFNNVRTGSRGGTTLDLDLHFRVDSNGAVTFLVDRIEATCTGPEVPEGVAFCEPPLEV